MFGIATFAGAQETNGLSAFSKAKAGVLLRHRLPCLGCHQINGEGGMIGPDLTTVRERRSAAYIAAIVADPQRVVPGAAMPRIAMPTSTRDLIVKYLASQPGNAPDASVPAGTPPAATPDGPGLYAKWCAACHGASGRGDGPNAARLPIKPAAHSSGEAMSARPDDSLFDTIASGGAVMNRSPRMPPFGGSLTTAEIRALVRHIRSLCKCEGPSWSRKP
jgi:mono/diheme cytochrome c family protein